MSECEGEFCDTCGRPHGVIDWAKVKSDLEYIALGDHMGDVNNGLVHLVRNLGLGTAKYNECLGHIVFSWETLDDDYEEDEL